MLESIFLAIIAVISIEIMIFWLVVLWNENVSYFILQLIILFSVALLVICHYKVQTGDAKSLDEQSASSESIDAVTESLENLDTENNKEINKLYIKIYDDYTDTFSYTQGELVNRLGDIKDYIVSNSPEKDYISLDVVYISSKCNFYSIYTSYKPFDDYYGIDNKSVTSNFDITSSIGINNKFTKDYVNDYRASGKFDRQSFISNVTDLINTTNDEVNEMNKGTSKLPELNSNTKYRLEVDGIERISKKSDTGKYVYAIKVTVKPVEYM